MNTLLLAKQDLDTYNSDQLQTLGHYYGLSNLPKTDLAWLVAIQLYQPTQYAQMESNDMFVFYSKSADKKPGYGKGAGWSEHVSDPKQYSELALIPDWRKTLSNFWEEPFVLDGHTWNTIEHYFHAAKFRKNHPHFYLTFSADSNSMWNKDPAKAKSYGKAGKSASTNKRLGIAANIKMHPDFYTGIDRKAMTGALYAKFSQSPQLRKILSSTGDAKLYHLITTRGQKSTLQHWDHLEKIRDCLLIYPEPVIFDQKVMDDILN